MHQLEPNEEPFIGFVDFKKKLFFKIFHFHLLPVLVVTGDFLTDLI
jgi:hypothetical protein